MIHSLSDCLSKNIGENTNIWQYSVVLPKARIGDNCNICMNCFVENEVSIGNNVTIKNGVYLWDGITIEDFVQIGPNVTFTNDKYPRAKKVFNIQQTYIKTGASIGGGAIILGGITIGEYSLIGAGSLITKDIPPYTLWYGSPATQKGYVTKNGTILTMKLTDNAGKKYQLKNFKPILND
jgi:UDP-2-acetamido-3-amino-2,3-dideoxy-glucuronate N-acetyltransferase